MYCSHPLMLIGINLYCLNQKGRKGTEKTKERIFLRRMLEVRNHLIAREGRKHFQACNSFNMLSLSHPPNTYSSIPYVYFYTMCIHIYVYIYKWSFIPSSATVSTQIYTSGKVIHSWHSILVSLPQSLLPFFF